MSGARWFPDDMPSPAVSRDTLPWWQAAAEHRLVVQRCDDCGRTRMPPGPCCPACRSFRHGWLEVSGRGTVYSWTIVHRAPLASLRERGRYVIVVVDLDGSGGVRLLSNLVDCEPNVVRIGLAVEVAWEDLAPDLAVPRFRPAT